MTDAVRERSTIYAVLDRQHRELEALFAKIHALGAARIEEARVVFAALADRLVDYLRRTRAIAYPVLARIAGLAGTVERARRSHSSLEAALDELRQPRITPSEWLRAVRRIEVQVEQHVEAEERDIFPIARRSLPLAEAHRLADELRQAAVPASAS